MSLLPRSEYPRPQFVRESWLNLNGNWTVRFDPGKCGLERKWALEEGFEVPIQVPFCPESALSGVELKEFIEQMWYHRKITVPKEWENRRILLHFGGVDYECQLFLNGVAVTTGIDERNANLFDARRNIATHVGGASAFTVDITKFVTPGREADLVLLVKDDLRSGNQPFGKQCPWFDSIACSYTRITGIWQTVWMEPVHPHALKQCRIVPDLDGGRFSFVPLYFGLERGGTLTAIVSTGGRKVAETTVACTDGVPFSLTVPDPVAWEPGNPFLYDILFQVKNGAGEVIDEVTSYAGLRKFHKEGDKLFLNNHPIYLRLVLDQGFYEKGLWTAPGDADLKRDIELSMAAGFNGARLHQKIFDERFHYWADRLGYLTWGEFPDWGMGFWKHFSACEENSDFQRAYHFFLTEWASVVERDANHPSLIVWTPFNETQNYRNITDHTYFLADAYQLTKRLDPTRLVNETSGYTHVKTDLWTVHEYEQDPEKLKEKLFPADAPVAALYPQVELPAYEGQPYLVDECGGVKYIPAGKSEFSQRSWGYGSAPATKEEAFARIKGIIEAILSLPGISGYCYTQLTDIEQEQNGIYNYDRTEKFDPAEIRSVFGKKPEWSRY